MEKMRNILRILKNKGMRHLESHKNVLTTKQNYASTLDKKMVASMAINASKLMVKKSLDQQVKKKTNFAKNSKKKVNASMDLNAVSSMSKKSSLLPNQTKPKIRRNQC